MKKSFVFSYLFGFSLLASTTTQAALPLQQEEVALNPRTGDLFSLSGTNNPQGAVTIQNDSLGIERGQAIQTIPLSDSPQPGARYEIELTSERTLSYLVQTRQGWKISGLRNVRGHWEKLPESAALSGSGVASHLTSLPDGRMALTVQAKSDQPAEVLLIENSTVQKTPTYAVIERIPEAALTAEMDRISTAVGSSDETSYDSGNGLGFSAGLLGGIGLAYRRHFADHWGVQIGGIAWGNADQIWANIGVTLMRTLHKTKSMRFYALAGVSTFYSSRQENEYRPCEPELPCDPVATTHREESFLYNFGTGIGMEFMLAQNLGLSIEVPVSVQMKKDKNGFGFKGIYPIPGASLIYYF